MKKIIFAFAIFSLFVFGCSTLFKDYKPTTDMEEGKIYNVSIVDSSCKMKGSSSCCNFYGCYVSIRYKSLLLTHQYLEFEEDTCSFSDQCTYPLFNPDDYWLNITVTRIQKINGYYEFIDILKQSKNNRG